MHTEAQTNAVIPPLLVRNLTVAQFRDFSLTLPLNQINVLSGAVGSGKSLIARGIICERSMISIMAPNSRTAQFMFQIPDIESGNVENVPAVIDLSPSADSKLHEITFGETIGLRDPLLSLALCQGEPRCHSCGAPSATLSDNEAIRSVLALKHSVLRTENPVVFGVWYPAQALGAGKPAQVASAIETLFELGQGRFILGNSLKKFSSRSDVTSYFAAVNRVQGLTEFGSVQRVLSAAQMDDAHSQFGKILNEIGYASGQQLFIAVLDSAGEVLHLVRTSERACCSSCGEIGLALNPLERAFALAASVCEECSGALDASERLAQETSICLKCEGSKLSGNVLAVNWRGDTVRNWLSKSLGQLIEAVREGASSSGSEAEHLWSKQILDCERFISQLRLANIPLSRPFRELSRGERLKAKVIQAIAFELSDALFLFDGIDQVLHPLDLEQLLVLSPYFLEHENSLLLTVTEPLADRPALNQIMLSYSPNERRVLSEPVTKKAAQFAVSIKLPQRGSKVGRSGDRLADYEFLTAMGAVSIPRGGLCGIIGPTGAGKSRLLRHLYEQAAVIKSRAAKSLRSKTSEAVTFYSSFTDSSTALASASAVVADAAGIDRLLGAFFASLPLARQRGFSEKHFLLSSTKGRCPRCKGAGAVLSPDSEGGAVFEECDSCFGERFNADVSDVLYAGCNIAQIYRLGIAELKSVFRAQDKLLERLDLLEALSFSHLTLGSGLNFLSLSERERLALCRVVNNKRRGENLLLLEQPFDDLDSTQWFEVYSQFNSKVRDCGTVAVTTLRWEVAALCDVVVALSDNGEIAFVGDPALKGLAYWSEHHYSHPLPSRN